MTWEETIKYIRNDKTYKNLVADSYLDSNLKLNIDRYGQSKEWAEIKLIFKKLNIKTTDLLDIGSGNGITAVNFALDGFKVSSVEPDPSITVGSGAIKFLKNELHLPNLNVIESFGENLPFENESFDVVFMRQALHHAHHLNTFIAEAARVLKKSGYLFCIREHVVFNSKDKLLFLENHPLQKFYHGENAFTLNEYKNAFKLAGLQPVTTLSYFESVINYYPTDISNKEAIRMNISEMLKKNLKQKLGIIADISPLFFLYKLADHLKFGGPLDERRYPGRMYSFIQKNK